MKIIRKLSVICFLLTFISISFVNVFAVGYTVNDIDKRINRLLNYEYSCTNTNSVNSLVQNYFAPNAGTGESDWFIISLARNGTSFSSDTYINSLNKAISNIYKSGIKRTKITDLQRIGLASTACNKDIQNITGINLLADCTYNRELSELSAQGIMTLDYALILLDCKNFNIPQNAVTTRDDIVSKILSLQLDNGGFALTGTAPDADVTAMSVTALAPYIKNNNNVKEAVEKALNRISKMQKDDGSFASYGKLNCESTAQVVVMLTSLGIEPESDNRFIKNGKSAFDALLTYQTDNGGFSHLQNGNDNQMASYQAFYALVAYKSFILTSQSLYDFSNESNSQQTVTASNSETSSNKNQSNLQSQSSNNIISNYSSSSNNCNNNSAQSTVYNVNSEFPVNQYNNTIHNINDNGQSSVTKDTTYQDETVKQQKTEQTDKPSEAVLENNTNTQDEIIKKSSVPEINNYKNTNDNYLYSFKNLTGTSGSVFILLLGFAGLYTYFIKKY